MNRREQYISQLRKLADLLEANKSLPLPDNGNLPPTPPSYLPDPSAPAQSWPPSRVGPPEHWADDWDSPEDSIYDDSRVKSFADHLAAAIRKVLP